MRIGVLTFHSQLNYGGVIQCWALVRVLRMLGHDVRVVDRWLDAKNMTLVGPIGTTGPADWKYIIKHGLAGCGWLTLLLRQWRTVRFVRALGLTDYHFLTWREAPRDLGLDCLVVGSDQVWNGSDWNDVGVYLLEGAPACPALAYAASFGMKELPPRIDYAAGFRRFADISVREKEGVALVAATGYPRPVAHVVDPVLLLPPDVWGKAVRTRARKRRMVCYFLSEDVDGIVRELEPFARDEQWEVVVLGNPRRMLPMPETKRAILRQMRRRFHEIFGRTPVKVATWYGPKEFMRAFSCADACITDSFHAVMFSCIYDVNVRFLRPKTAIRQDMLGRVEEFAAACVSGEMFARDVRSAMASLKKDPRTVFDHAAISALRQESADWLRSALDEVCEAARGKGKGACDG